MVYNSVMVIWQLSVGTRDESVTSGILHCQKEYPLTSATWLNCELQCTTHWVGVFFKVMRRPVVGFNWSQAQVHFLFRTGIQFISFLRQKLNYLKRYLFKDSMRASVLALAESVNKRKEERKLTIIFTLSCQSPWSSQRKLGVASVSFLWRTLIKPSSVP